MSPLPIIKTYSSPNYGPRPLKDGKLVIDMIILHHTDMLSAQEAIDHLCSPEKQVSSHYVIGKNGRIFQLVEDQMRAWHAGLSFWKSQENLNDTSIGIELDNPGYQYGPEPFTQELMDSLFKLLEHLVDIYQIHPSRVIAHSDIAPGRKQDPSHLFDWAELAKQGFGLWPKRTLDLHSTDINDIQKTLSAIGYHCSISGELDEITQNAIDAFQHHFCADHRDGSIHDVFLNTLQGFVTQDL